MTVQESNVGPITFPSKTIADGEGTVYHIEYRGPLTSVRVTLPDGTRAAAYAKLAEGDNYNQNFGETLALTRAISRVMTKFEKKLAREGYLSNR